MASERGDVYKRQGKVETTTFRRDGVYADHRHPEQVTFTPDLTEMCIRDSPEAERRR